MSGTRFLSVLAIILFFKGDPLFSQIKKPVDPHIPSVGLKEKKNVKFYPVLIDFSREKKIRGSVILGLRIRVPGTGGVSHRYIKISDIDSIDFLKWRGNEYREKSFLFKPSMIKITLNDGSSLIINENIPPLNSIDFLPGGKSSKRKIYSLFYDYFKKRRWINSGSSERDYPEKNPHRETLVRIEFLKAEKKDLLTEEILKFIKK